MCLEEEKYGTSHKLSLSFNSAVSLSLPLSGARERKDEKKSPLLSAYLLSLCHQSRLYEQKKFESGDKEELFFGSLVLFFPSSDLSTSSSLSLSPPLSLFLSSYSCGTLHALTFQMSSAYSLIVLSLENIPEPATLMIDILVHLSSSRYAASTLSWASM